MTVSAERRGVAPNGLWELSRAYDRVEQGRAVSKIFPTSMMPRPIGLGPPQRPVCRGSIQAVSFRIRMAARWQAVPADEISSPNGTQF
jgi:hypothetical protein